MLMLVLWTPAYMADDPLPTGLAHRRHFAGGAPTTAVGGVDATDRTIFIAARRIYSRDGRKSSPWPR